MYSLTAKVPTQGIAHRAPAHLLQNVFSYYRMCSLTIECVLLQLKFLPKASLTEHLQRTSFCDLFLDNREYNSGTTWFLIFFKKTFFNPFFIPDLSVDVLMCSCVDVFMCSCVHVFMCSCVHVLSVDVLM